ncbi:MAG: hypothetical protein D3910_05140 [Candidatus Electrothrix sp. ATG2]|nr:hypothetical protein [Candidatus Electrothrix sp. ATG2]
MKKILLLIVSTFLLTGCAVVTSDNIIGNAPTQLSPENWNGTWRNEDTVLQVKVLDAENGLIKIAWFEDKDKDLQADSITVQIRKGEKWEYLTLLEGSIYKDIGKYCWGRVKKESKRLLFWFPDPERFEQAVQAKILTGEVMKTKKENTPSTHIKLSGPAQDIIRQVESGKGDYFLWDTPLTFLKID